LHANAQLHKLYTNKDAERVSQARQVDQQNEDRFPIVIGGHQFGYGVGPGKTPYKIISKSQLSEL
jgi:uncharacterized protein YllA (UPF0747 family)